MVRLVLGDVGVLCNKCAFCLKGGLCLEGQVVFGRVHGFGGSESFMWLNHEGKIPVQMMYFLSNPRCRYCEARIRFFRNGR